METDARSVSSPREAAALKNGSSAKENWREAVAQFRRPSLTKSGWQIINTFVPYILIGFLMYISLSYSFWLMLALAPIAAGLRVRLFIIFHDCGHGSFFKSNKANDIVGFICGCLCLTPYQKWRHAHAIHHATSGNLERRVSGTLSPLGIKTYAQNTGAILTLTVKEYRQLSGRERLIYRLYRHPLVLFVVIPLVLFLVLHRLTSPDDERVERNSVWATNLTLVFTTLVMGYWLGFGPFLLVETIVIIMTAMAGVWMFYVQHQFEETYWEQKAEWNFGAAALQGSSYYKLPAVLQWFTGNIGFHHIHHLSPRIPNYRLQKCHESNALFQQTQPITIWSGMRTIPLKLWDEEKRKMVSFRRL